MSTGFLAVLIVAGFAFGFSGICIQAAEAKTVAALAKALDGDDPAAVSAARNELTGLVRRASRPDAGAERASTAAALTAALGTTHSVPGKRTLLDLLSLVGDAKSVPVLAAAIGVPGLHDTACFGLTRIPDASAKEALVEALKSDKKRGDSAMIALVSAVGQVRVPAAAPLLGKVAEKADSTALHFAAVEALSINPMAYAYVHIFWDALPSPRKSKNSATRQRVWDSMVRVGDAFIASGEVGAASDFYCEVLEAASNAHEKGAIILGLSRSSRRRAEDVVMGALEDEDERVRGSALKGLEILRGRDMIEKIAALLEKAPPAQKVEYLRVVAKRIEPNAGDFAVPYLAHEDAAVRAAAMRAIEGRTSEGVVKALIAAVAAGGRTAEEGAIGVLTRAPGEAVAAAIKTAAAAASGEARKRLEAVAQQRKD